MRPTTWRQVVSGETWSFQREATMRKMRRWLLPAMTVLASTAAQARMDPAAIEIAAMGIAAYEMNKDKCVFENIIHSKFKELDSYFRNEAPYGWDRAKRKATMEIPATLRSGMLGTDTKNTGLAAECANAGKLMNLGMVPAMFFVMSDAAFGAALKRLSESGARARETGQLVPDSKITDSSNKPNIGNARLSKHVVETAFACLRSGITANKDSGDLFPDCLKQTAEQVEPLNAQMTFRLGFLVYRTVHVWGVEKGAPIKLPSPFEEEKRCTREADPASCITKATTQAFVEFLEIIGDIGGQDDLDSFRDAMVESGG